MPPKTSVPACAVVEERSSARNHPFLIHPLQFPPLVSAWSAHTSRLSSMTTSLPSRASHRESIPHPTDAPDIATADDSRDLLPGRAHSTHSPAEKSLNSELFAGWLFDSIWTSQNRWPAIPTIRDASVSRR